MADPVSERVSRLTLLIKLLTLRDGCTGRSLGTIQELTKLWNENVIPVIPAKGTVGASGALATSRKHFARILELGCWAAEFQFENYEVSSEAVQNLTKRPNRGYVVEKDIASLKDFDIVNYDHGLSEQIVDMWMKSKRKALGDYNEPHDKKWIS